MLRFNLNGFCSLLNLCGPAKLLLAVTNYETVQTLQQVTGCLILSLRHYAL